LKGTGINSALTISPANLDFGAVPVKTTVTDTITLSNTGNASVTISGFNITPASGSFTLGQGPPGQLAAGATPYVILNFTPPDRQAYNGSITFNTDDATTPQRIVNLTGRGIKGSFALGQTALEFGSIKLGKDTTLLLTVKNTGSAALQIESLNA